MEQKIYPINTSAPWPRNQWWVAANSSEVTRKPMERTILGEPVVLYRTEAGAPVAMAGMCPHRGYPMVEAKVVGDALECGYHGITFGCDGACERIPTQSEVPSKWKIRTYPAVQRWEWVWIWTGDPELADESKIPDPWCVGKPGWHSQVSIRETDLSRFTLLIDNLFDLSHLNYLHSSLLGSVNELVQRPVEMQTKPDGVFRLSRKVPDFPWSPYFEFLFPGRGAEGIKVSTESFSDYFGPCLTLTGGPFLVAQTGERLGEINFLHAMTPETESSTHYFGGVTRDFRHQDEAFDKSNLDLYLAVRGQDLEGLEKVERMVSRGFDTARELSALQDAGGIRVRRMITAQIEGEQSANER